jgi:hypothetical protein
VTVDETATTVSEQKLLDVLFALAFGTRFLALKKVLIRFGCCAISVQLVAQAGNKSMGRSANKQGCCWKRLVSTGKRADQECCGAQPS